jgi:monoamine oxidase
VVLALPLPALEGLARVSEVIGGPVWRRLFSSVQGFPATKLYAWYDRPWWRDGDNAPTGLRTTTDLPNRMMYYFDEGPDRPASMLASYTDFRYNEPILALADGRTGGAAASPALMRAVTGWLRAAHPGAAVPDAPVGSAFQHWGADPREVGWHFWRAGVNSDEMIGLARQPDPALPIHLCGEVFSNMGAWVEGAIETAEVLAQKLLDAIPAN